MILIGIDPGLTGAVAALDTGGNVWVRDMPVTAYSATGAVKNALDGPALARMIGAVQSHVFIERVSAMPGQGVASMFSLGMSYWGAAGVCAGLGLPVTLVTPGEWKRHFKLGADKDMARGLASRLYPQIDLSRKKDHGRAEALLIARYGMETWKGVK